jgi:hypothetical protein
MLTISIVSIILVTSAIFYSLCRIPSRTYSYINSRSIVFVHRDDRKYFGDLIERGDIEGIHRLMQILQQKELLEIIEMGEEIYLVNHNPASVDNFRTVPRGLCVSDYNPVEDLQNLRSLHIGFRHVNQDSDRYVTGHKPVPVNQYQENNDDLFISDFDILKTLKHLSPQAPFIPVSQAS